MKLLPWEISHTLIWQMQAVFHRSGYEAEIPIWIFVGLGAVDVAILVYLGTSLLGRQRGPHDRASRTIVAESVTESDRPAPPHERALRAAD